MGLRVGACFIIVIAANHIKNWSPGSTPPPLPLVRADICSRCRSPGLRFWTMHPAPEKPLQNVACARARKTPGNHPELPRFDGFSVVFLGVTAAPYCRINKAKIPAIAPADAPAPHPACCQTIVPITSIRAPISKPRINAGTSLITSLPFAGQRPRSRRRPTSSGLAPMWR